MIDFLLLVLFMAVIGGTCFWTGYRVGQLNERDSQREVKRGDD